MDSKVDTFRELVDKLNDLSFAKYGSHSYSSGYLGSLSVELLQCLPKKKQEFFISVLSKSIVDKV